MSHLKTILIQPVSAIRGKEVLSFKTITECAKHFQISSTYVKMHLAEGGDYRGFRFEHTDPRGIPENEIFFTPLVAVAPSGEAIRFDGVADCASRFHINNSSLLKAMRGTTKMLYGWHFFWLSDYEGDEFVELTDKLYETFVPTISHFNSGSGVKKISAPFKVVEKNPYEGMTPIATGYYDAEMGMSVCPICQKVIGNNCCGRGVRHLLKCLEPYNYTIKHYRIKVWSKKGLSNTSETSSMA